MGTKIENKNLSAWHLLKNPDQEFENNRDNEISDEEEYSFFRLAGNDHNALEMEKGE